MADRPKTICIYAPSGDAKTSQCVFFAKYIKRVFNKRTRLISSDGGGWAPVADEGLIRNQRNPEGIVDAFNMTNRPYYLADWRKLAKGQWPKIVKRDGVLVREWFDTTPEEWAQIGGYFVEGLTSVGSGFISHISKQDNSKNSETKVLFAAAGYTEDGEHFGSTDQGHVGMVQNELYNLTNQFGTLPVNLVVWTALVEQAKDKTLKKVGIEIPELGGVFGPRLCGDAKTAEAPSWFSDCLHIHAFEYKDKVELIGGQVTEVDRKRLFAYFVRHRDGAGNLFLAKSSTGPTQFRKLLEMHPHGCVEFTLERGLDGYLETLDGLKEVKEREVKTT